LFYAQRQVSSQAYDSIVVSITGYILDVFSLYFADGKTIEANILNSLMKDSSLLLE